MKEDYVKLFGTINGWVSQFEIAGKKIGGALALSQDPRLYWHLSKLGDVKGMQCLELGALEGAHTKMMEEAGVNVTAIEGNPNNFLKCLIVKHVFDLRGKFIFCDFCKYVNECDKVFDFVSAAGVLYHQRNPAELIFGLSNVADTVIVWSQVANKIIPSGIEYTIKASGNIYKGKINTYGKHDERYCGGLEETAFWMYGEEMLRCFRDAGFINITQEDCQSNINGDCLLFIASKKYV